MPGIFASSSIRLFRERAFFACPDRGCNFFHDFFAFPNDKSIYKISQRRRIKTAGPPAMIKGCPS